MERDNKTYEINYLMTPLIPEDKTAEEAAVLRKIIEDNKGFVVGEDQPKMQKLSYAIKKFDKGYYGWFKFSAGAEFVDNIKNGFGKNENILRALITEAGKESAVQFAPRHSLPVRQAGAATLKPEGSLSESAEKVEIKPEQIDQKLEEILKESSL